MSALSANANSVVILSESADHVLVKLFMYQHGNGGESSQLKVNAETLTHRTQILVVNPGTARFVPGSVIHDTTGNSNATAVVCYSTAANTIVVTQITGNTGFTTSDQITAQLEGGGTANVFSVTNPPRQLTIDSVQWQVGEGNNATVSLEFANSSAFETAFVASESGYFGRNELDAPIVPSSALVNQNGNLYVSTYGIIGGGGYSIVVSLRKRQGYAEAPGY